MGGEATRRRGRLAVAALVGLLLAVRGAPVSATLPPRPTISFKPAVASGPIQKTVIPQGLAQPNGVAVDGAGDVFVADGGNSRVLELSSGGVQTTVAFTGLNHPADVAVDGAGDVFVADGGNARVVELSSGGVQTTLAFTGLTGLGGIAVDAAGDVFVADTSTSRVVELSSGGVQTTLGFTGLSYPGGVAVDGVGDVFVADGQNSRVVELPSGGVQTTLALTGLSLHIGVAVDGVGDVFVADSDNTRVVELPSGGAQTTVPFTGLGYPSGVAIDGAGDVFVTDIHPSQVVELPSGGVQTTLAFTGLHNPGGVAVDGAGDVFVVDHENARVVELPRGGVETTLAFTGLNNPYGLAVDGAGNVYVADTGNARVVELPKDGVQTTLPFTGLRHPTGVAVDGAGDVFIVDGSMSQVLELPLGGVQTTLAFTGLYFPSAVAVDGAGNVFVTDTDNVRVVELSNGGVQTTLPFTNLSGPAGVAVDSAGDVFVVDNYNSQVVELSKDGVQTTVPFTGLSSPGWIALDGAGNGFVTSNSNDGSLLELMGAFGTPASPWSVSVQPGNTTVKVSWLAPPATGSPVTGYVITPYIGSTAQPAQTFNTTATSDVVTGLLNGTTYTFQVAAMNAIGTGPNSAGSDAVTPGTPSAPGFPGAAPGNNAAKVAWTTPSANNGASITGYQVTPYVGATAGTPQTFNTTALSDIVTGLVNGTTYTFSIRPINANGIGASAVTAAIVVGAPTAPVFPNATPGNGTARVGWVASTANGAPVTSYTITPVKAGVAQSPVVFGSASFETMTGLTNGASYTFRVTATNSIGTSPVGTTSSIIVGTPAQPGFISAAPGDATATVSFTTPAANGSPLISFTVTPYVGSTAQTAQVFTTPAATHLVVTGLTNGTAYTFRVLATNALGAGPIATTAVITVGTPTAPGYPGAAPGNATAKVAWLASNGNGAAVTGYVVTPLISGAAQTPQTFNSTATTEIVTGLTNGTSYTFRVSAINGRGTGPFATSTTAIKVGTPSAPGFPSAATGNASAKVSWLASSANAAPVTGYVVTPYIGAVAQPSQTFKTTATSQVITGLVNGTSYTFRVAGINSVGTGPYSTTATVKIGTPTAPNGVTAVAGTGQATVSWVAPASNGSPVTGYVITPYVGSTALAAQTFATTATSDIITGLTSGTTYSFKVAAVNTIGTSALSASSNTVTPA